MKPNIAKTISYNRTLSRVSSGFEKVKKIIKPKTKFGKNITTLLNHENLNSETDKEISNVQLYI